MIIFGLTLFMVAVATVAGEIALASILGVLGTFITQLIKKLVGTSGNMALLLTIGISAILGFVAAWSVGEWDTSDIFGSTAIVFSLATISYRFLLSKDAPVETTTV